MTDDARAALRSLAERSSADGDPTGRTTTGDGERAAPRDGEETTDCTTPGDDPIDRASAAVEDLDAAAAFVDGGGLEVLERAVPRAEGERARRGEAALSTLRACRRALE